MYAIIQEGGRQYRVKEGDRILADRHATAGESVELTGVLMYAKGDDIRIGRPTVDGVKIIAEAGERMRDKKVMVVKFKKRKNYRRKAGHRQDYTPLVIRKIVAG